MQELYIELKDVKKIFVQDDIMSVVLVSGDIIEATFCNFWIDGDQSRLVISYP